jgi:hypothetical protein
MSRVLRRPMFRGGIADSEGVGITSGLDTPKRGLVDGPGGYAGELSFGERFRMAMEQDNANKQAKYDALKSNKSYYLANLFKSNSDQKDSTGFDYSRDTGLGRFVPKFNEYAVKEPLAALYNLIGVPINKATEFVTGYNPGFSGERFFNLDTKNRKSDTAEFFGMDTSAQPGMTYKNEQKKIAEAKANAEKLKVEEEKLLEPTAEVAKRKELPTLSEDIDTYSKLLMDNAGPDKDEYTRQKYLTLAKFGLNLLKPTPAGVKPSLLSSVATAAEKPLEEYGNISMQESKEGRALKQLAAQLAFQKNMPGTMAKGIQDLMAVNPKMTVEEAISIVTTGKNSAAIAKEKFNEIIQRQKDIEDLVTKDSALKKISKINPNLITDYAKIAVEQGLYNSELKGYYKDYNKLKEGSIYFAEDKQTDELVPHKFIKGKLYSIREPEFKQKSI